VAPDFVPKHLELVVYNMGTIGFRP
jgi:hypothetical protein